VRCGVFVFFLCASCALPDEADAALAVQLRALDAASVSADALLDLLVLETDAVLALERQRRIGVLHRRLLEATWIRGVVFDPQAFDAAVRDPLAADPIVDEVREGRIRIDDARSMAADVALVLRLRDPRAARDAILGRLRPVAEFDATATALRKALAEEARGVRRALRDATTTNKALTRALDADADGDTALASGWRGLRAAVTARVEDGERRRAVAELFDQLGGLARAEIRGAPKEDDP
jgi:hypothetical protein